MTITINNAIDRLRELHGELVREERLEKADSIRLSIEALKRTSQRRENLSWKSEPLLPGEKVE